MFLRRSRFLNALVIAVGLAGAAGAVAPARQAPAARAAQPFTVIAADGRKSLPAYQVGDQLMVALDDLAPLLGLTVREDAAGGGLSVTTRGGKRVLLTPGQPLASADGRLVSLPAPPTRDGRRWLVPLEFVSRALAPALDTRL
ncbi:MAG: amiC, partial [Acidobacteria bacterium]|nr:amiC [Acidobacteriota bacterium]